MREEKISFEEALRMVTVAWKFTGIQADYDGEASRHTLWSFLRKRHYYIANLICNISAALSVFGLIHELSVDKILYMVPCMFFSFLGASKSIFLVYHENEVRNIITSLRALQSIDETGEKEIEVQSIVQEQLSFLNSSTKMLRVASYVVVATFCFGPVVVIFWQYWSTSELNLFLPYTLWYPFDAYSYVGWPFAYVHQFWAAWLAIFFVHGPDCFYYIACTFIYIQLCSLQYDMSKLGISHIDDQLFNIHVRNLVHRHNEIIRCIDIMNIIFGKSSLYNVVSSSFLICLTGFNATAIDNLVLMAPFAAFVVVTSVQIYLLCYYGDMVMLASVRVSDAIYGSQWYNLNTSSRKVCLLIITRSQKQCEIKAFGFKTINLNTFAKIMSSAWSYFTIISTMYSEANS